MKTHGTLQHVDRKDVRACFDGSLLRKELRMAIPMKYSSQDNALEATYTSRTSAVFGGARAYYRVKVPRRLPYVMLFTHGAVPSSRRDVE